MPAITVLYFAHLRDQRGVDQEQITTTATTARDVYHDLTQRHGLHFSESNLVVAINEEMVHWESPVRDGDTIVFLPPVSGG